MVAKPTKNDLAAHTKALDRHTEALRAHTDALKAFTQSLQNPRAQAGKTISRDTIRRRLANKWGKDPATVKEADPIGNYIKGGPGVMSAYWAVLNSSPEFSPDGLDLQTSDTAFVTTVGELIDAIASWYSSHGWNVVT